ncbi:hypothetical protein Tco_1195077 [Tanacetum coccineum]
MNLEASNTSLQPILEQMDEEFTTTAYLNVQENLKLSTESEVRLEEPASSAGTLSSLQNLDKEISFTNQFLAEKSQEDEPEKTNTEVEVQSMVSGYLAIQAPLRDHFRDLPEADIKEIIHHRMWESNSYKAHEDHKKLKKKRRYNSPKPPPGSPPHHPCPPPLPSSPSGASGSTTASNSAQESPPPPPSLTTNQGDQPQGSAAPGSSKTAASTDMVSDDEDIGSKHIPKVNLNPAWFKPLTEEERLASPKPAWSIPSSNLHVPPNNWASVIASSYQGITELTSEHLEGPAYEIIKAFHPDVIHLQFQMEECHKVLTNQVDDRHLRTHMRILSVVSIEVFLIYGYDYIKNIALRIADNQEYTIVENDFKDLYPSDFEDLYLLNLQATGLEFQHDYKILDSPRVVLFRDKYGVQMIMRFNEIHKFNDETLQQIDEALDYRRKQFMFAIQKRLKNRRIFWNLESFVGGIIREGDYRLLQRTE